MSHDQSFRTFRLPSILLGLASIVEFNGVLAQEQAVIPAGDTAAIENAEVSTTKAKEHQLEKAAKVLQLIALFALTGHVCAQDTPAPSSPTRKAALAWAAAGRLAPVQEREFQDCRECPAMVAVPSGTYWMGSPATEADRINDEIQHRVTIPAPFAIGKTEVTFDQWDACAEAGYCSAVPRANEGDRGWGRGSRPVIEVSWNEITGADGKTRGFLAWLSAKAGVQYRLPTEAQWEYAARGSVSGSQNEPPFYFGTNKMELCHHEHTFVCITGDPKTAPVAQFPANPFGLHDMLGNVTEWVQDCYTSYNNTPTDRAATPTTKSCSRVVRGGSWAYYLWFSRAAVRDRADPEHRNDHRGFRVARSLAASDR